MSRTIPLGLTELAYERSGVHSRSDASPEILKVLRYTPTTVVCRRGSGEIRFNLDDGSERGGRYGDRASVVTAATLSEIARFKLEEQLRVSAYKLEGLARKVAHADRRGMKVFAVERRLDSIKVALLAVENMLTIEPGEER